jgi:ankyrin repeat protein
MIPVLMLGTLSAAGPDRRLADAAKKQDGRAVRDLLRQHADVNGRQPDGATALHWAVHWDDLETTNLLLREGADVNAANDFGVTPLSLACTNGNAVIVDTLLKANANPNATLETGETPLMTAARTGRVAVVNALLARGATVDARESTQEQTALMWAVSERHNDVVHALVARGADVRARSKSGFTPLLFGARVGNTEAVRELLAAGADVNETAADGATPLLVATVRGHVALATFLLDHGANANAAGTGYTALHWAAGSWETELTGPRGIDTSRDEEWTALRGLGSGKLDLVKALLAHGANPNAPLEKAPPRTGFTVAFRSLAGATPFYVAAMAGDAETMRVLAAAGADARLGTKDNMTPLMAASGVGRVLAESRVTNASALEAARLAWELGSDVKATSNTGDTALHGAAHIRADELVQFLVDKGALLDVKNKRGETPLVIAERTVAAGSAPVIVRTSTGDLLRKLGAQ